MSRKTVKIIRWFGYSVFGVLLTLMTSGRQADAQPPAAAGDGQPCHSESLLSPYSVSAVFRDGGYVMMADSLLNVISDSTVSLAPFMEKLAELQTGRRETVSILHIGDSHVQAGYFTGRLRELFQGDFGDAGRGLIVPHRMAGMNEAPDYAVTTPFPFSARKATDRSLESRLGFTGVSATFGTPYNELKIWSKIPFNTVTVLHSLRAPLLREPDELGMGSYCTVSNTPTSTRIVLSQRVDSLTLTGFVAGDYDDPTFYGFSLENGAPGVLYHAVGLNGAAFEHFMNSTTIAQGGAEALRPDIIIVSLGTNNCFGGNFRYAQMHGAVDGFVRMMRNAYGGVPMLMTTPMESCSRRTVRGRRTYVPNPNVECGGRIIKQVAADNGAAVWDLYAAAGGAGAMEKWFAKGLANTDRIHLTENGYVLQGDMLYGAFVKYYNGYINTSR